MNSLIEFLERRDLLTKLVEISPKENGTLDKDEILVATFDEAAQFIDIAESTLLFRPVASGGTVEVTTSIEDGKLLANSSHLFLAGETVDVTLLSNLRGSESNNAIPPRGWQYRIAADGVGRFHGAKLESFLGAIPTEVELGDIDQDGDLDAVVAASDSTAVFLNGGSSWTKQSFNGSEAVGFADIDSDGDLDLLMKHGRRLHMAMNDQGNLFKPALLLTFKDTITDFELMDADLDGDVDVVGAGSTIEVWKNNGEGTFALYDVPSDQSKSQTPAFPPQNTDRIAHGDLDGDGDFDLLVSSARPGFGGPDFTSAGPSVWLNDGTGKFDPGQEIAGGGNVDLGDVDNDGDLDAVIGGLNDGYTVTAARLFRNDGSAVFAEVSPLPPEDYRSDGHSLFADIDGDSQLEVLTTGGDAWDLAPDASSGNLIRGLTRPSDAHAVGDIDGDGDVDLFSFSHRYAVNGTEITPRVWHNVDANTDVSVEIGNGQHLFSAGLEQRLQYDLTVRNQGAVDLTGVLVDVRMSNGLQDVSWTCLEELAAKCPSSGLGAPSFRTDLPADSLLRLGIAATVPESFSGRVEVAAHALLQGNQMDLNPINDESIDSDLFSRLLVSPEPNASLQQDGVIRLSSNLQSNISEITPAQISLQTTQSALIDKAIDVSIERSDEAALLIPSQTLFPGEVVGVTAKGIEIDGEVTSRVWKHRVSVQEGTGRFSKPTYLESIGVIETALGDINNDGLLDIVVLTQSEVQFWLNDGNKMEMSDQTLTANNQQHVTLADIDNDNDLDLLVGNYESTRILTNEGELKFERGRTLPVGGQPDLADLDADGDIDLVGRSSSGELQVGNNDGAGRFSFPRGDKERIEGNVISLEDVDGDGDLDVMANAFERVEILINEGGSFSKRRELDISASFADLDGDGDIDALTASGEVLYNNGRGDFQNPSLLSQSFAPTTVFGDLDGDGDLDALRNELWINKEGRFEHQELPSRLFNGTVGDVDHDGDLDIVAMEGGRAKILWQFEHDTDLAITVSNSDHDFAEGVATKTRYLVEVQNHGDEPVDGVQLTVRLDDQLLDLSWNCEVKGEATCSFADRVDAETSNLVDNVSIGGAAKITYFIDAIVPADAKQQVDVSAQLAFTGRDANSENNSATKSIRVLPYVVTPSFGGISAGDSISVRRGPADLKFEGRAGVLTLHTPNGSTLVEATNISAQGFQFEIPSNDLLGGQSIQATVNDVITTNGESLEGRVLQFRTAVKRGHGKLADAGAITDAIPFGAFPQSIQLADVDSDGDQDAILAFEYQSTLLLLNNDGSFIRSKQSLPAATSIDFGDLDGDGDSDLVLSTSGRNHILLNENGIFETSWRFGTSYTPRDGVVLGDLDADGDLDLAWVENPSRNGSGSDSVRVAWNQGDAKFEESNTQLRLGMSYDVALHLFDMEGDGDLDLASAAFDRISLWDNDGKGEFNLYRHLPSSSSPRDTFVEDLDGDGDSDFISANAIYENDGDGTFHQLVFEQFRPIRGIGDFDADNDLDLFSVSGQVLENLGDLEFESAPEQFGPRYFDNLAIGDVDADGDLDVLTMVHSSGQPRLHVLKNVDSEADVKVEIVGAKNEGQPGEKLELNVLVRNLGTAMAVGVGLETVVAVGLRDVLWDCSSTGCKQLSNGGLVDEFNLAPKEERSYRLTATIAESAGGSLSFSAVGKLPERQTDINPQNDSTHHQLTVRPYHTKPNHNEFEDVVGFEIRRLLGDADLAQAAAAGDIVVNGGLSGVISFEFQALEDGIRVTPVDSFIAGDVVSLSVSSLESGEVSIPSLVVQFRTPTVPSNGVFQQHPSAPKSAYRFGDLDNDGDLDAIGRRSVWINDGFEFIETQDGDLNWGRDALLVDVDGDDDLDVLDQRDVWLNDGAANFDRTGTEISVQTGSRLATGDLDGDGDQDVFASGRGGQAVLLNDSVGKFEIDTLSEVRSNATAVILVDVDNDGDLDAFVGKQTEASQILFNDGAANFERQINLNPNIRVSDAAKVQIGDIDFDGFPDLVLNAYPSVWLNDGTGNFEGSSESMSEPPFDSNLALGDIDGDRDLDILAMSQFYRRLWINDGAGKFASSSQEILNVRSDTTKLLDVDGDGDLDAYLGSSLWINDSIAGDFDRDGSIGFGDFLILSANFGQSEATSTQGDLNRDRKVDFKDFLLFASRLSPTPDENSSAGEPPDVDSVEVLFAQLFQPAA